MQIETASGNKTQQVLFTFRIQCLWKGAIARKRVRKQRADELVFIGMVSLQMTWQAIFKKFIQLNWHFDKMCLVGIKQFRFSKTVISRRQFWHPDSFSKTKNTMSYSVLPSGCWEPELGTIQPWSCTDLERNEKKLKIYYYKYYFFELDSSSRVSEGLSRQAWTGVLIFKVCLSKTNLLIK